MIRLILAALASAWLLPGGGLAQDKPKAPIDEEVAATIRILEDPDKGLNTKTKAIASLAALKAKAEPAIPALKAIFAREKNEQLRLHVVNTMRYIGKAAVPFLAEAVTDETVGLQALQQLGALGVEAKEAAPAVLKAAALPVRLMKQNTAPHSYAYQATAVATIRKIGVDADEALPAFVKVISTPIPPTMGFSASNAPWFTGVHDALDGIAELGPKAKSALPSLLQLLKNHQPAKRVVYPSKVLVACIGAIAAIEPEAESALPALRAFRDANKTSSTIEQAIEKAIDKIKGK